MSVIEGFTIFDYQEGVPYVSITKNGVTFNKAVVMKMGFPKSVNLLINYESKKIAIKPCKENDKNAVRFYGKKKSGAISVRLNGRYLIKTIEEMMNWNLDNEAYRIEARLLNEENMMLFDFNKAILLN